MEAILLLLVAKSRIQVLALALAVVIVAVTAGVVLGNDDDGQATPPVEQPQRDRRVRHQPDRDRPPAPPRLIGMTPEQVRRVLQPLGLKPDFVSQCGGSEPGRVILQNPGPSGHIRRRTISLWTDSTGLCSKGVAPRRCRDQDVEITNATERIEPEPANRPIRLVGIGVQNVSGVTCQLRAEVEVALTPPSTETDTLRGNPHHLIVDYRLGSRGVQADVPVLVAWENWCGDRGRWGVTVGVDPFADRTFTTPPAHCNNEEERSVFY